MDILLTKIVKTLFLPPGLIILLLLAGYFLARRFQTLGKFLLFGGFGLLLVLSLPVVARFNIKLLETEALSPASLNPPQAQAIVILSGGRHPDAPEYGGQDALSMPTLQRLHYGAWLYRHTGVPILVTGGTVYGDERVPEAELMRRSLTSELHIPVRWVETRSRNTWQNAGYSRQLLQQAGINRIYLVTQAWHMPRARLAFEAVGFDVIAAPTGFLGQKGDAPLIMDFLPGAGAFKTNTLFLHELLGMLWYRIRYSGQPD
jgi:uncharacterized SAM-binding protein YcdF (DUF218 family)